MSFLLLALLSFSAALAGPLTLQPVGDFGGIRVRGSCTLDTETRNCAIDTGGRATLTHPSLIQGNYPSLGEEKVQSVGFGVICQRIQLPAVQFAGQTAPQEVLSCPDFFEGISPTIGMDVFANRAFTFDFAHAELDWNPLWTAATYPLLRERHWMVVPAKIGGRQFELGFDTGAPVTLVDQSFVKENPLYFVPSKIPPSEMTIRRGLTAYELVSPIVVNGIELPGQQVHAGDFSGLKVSFPVILGANHMAGLRWYFNLEKNLWGLAR